MEKFRYLGVTITNTSDIREEIKCRINMGKIWENIILPVVLYCCETWSLTLREEHTLRLFENKVLRKIFVVKRDEITGEWRKLHNAELHAL